MNKEKILTVLNNFKSSLESDGYKVAAVFLYGSQNYGLDLYTENYQSDIDAKAIIIPTLDELVYNSKPVSFVKTTDEGQVDVKDIRVFIDTLVKANPAYVETLYTDYFVINDDYKEEISEIMSLKDRLVYALRAQFLRAIYGMMCEKDNALCHPYPTIEWKIEKWGYDGKQLSHNYRLLTLLEDYFVEHKPMKECFYPEETEKETMIAYKLNEISLEEAKELSKHFISIGKTYRESILSEIDESTIDYSVKDEITVLSRNIIKKCIVKNIEKQGENAC